MEVKNLQNELADVPVNAQSGIKLVKMTGDEHISVYAAEILPKTRLNPHYHLKGIETYQVLQGKGLMKIGRLVNGSPIWDETFEAVEGDFFSILENQVHQISNETEQILKMIFSCPESHVGDDRHFI